MPYVIHQEKQYLTTVQQVLVPPISHHPPQQRITRQTLNDFGLNLQNLKKCSPIVLAHLEYIVNECRRDWCSDGPLIGAPSSILQNMSVQLPTCLSVDDIRNLSSYATGQLWRFIVLTRDFLIASQVFKPRQDCFLIDWLSDASTYNEKGLQVCSCPDNQDKQFEHKDNFVMCSQSNQMVFSLGSSIIDILFDYKVSSTRFPVTMQMFSVLLLGRPLGHEELFSQMTLIG